MPQDKVFYAGEADKWFERNKKSLAEKGKGAVDFPIEMIKTHGLKPENVLEIGCSNGWRLGRIHDEVGSRCVGIEPSEAAITDGKKSFPAVEFRRGVISELPVKEDETFDLVIVNYVLHWVSREFLMKALYEIDRTVKDGGRLIIGDFLPDSSVKTPYHHLPKEKVYTFKLDYPSIFISTGMYEEVDKVIYAHGEECGLGMEIPSNVRSSCCMLKKSLGEFYKEIGLNF
ncbi:MAG: class I SAM-dependent methyltransferase [Nitrospinota bacterium]|nr:class I SAM-dependent methyltransferase [Nitrospinota bacterium]